MTLNRITERLAGNPRILFVIDASGALLTALFISFFWLSLQEYIGMPAAILRMLAIAAFLICFCSVSCFLFVKNGWPAFIRVIAIANLLYCMLTLYLLGINYAALTIIGIGYFLAEIMIMSLLIYLEFKVSAALLKDKRG